MQQFIHMTIFSPIQGVVQEQYRSSIGVVTIFSPIQGVVQEQYRSSIGVVYGEKIKGKPKLPQYYLSLFSTQECKSSIELKMRILPSFSITTILFIIKCTKSVSCATFIWINKFYQYLANMLIKCCKQKSLTVTVYPKVDGRPSPKRLSATYFSQNAACSSWLQAFSLL